MKGATEGDTGRQLTARIRAGWVALTAGAAIFAVKLLAWRLTGSTAVLSDAMESIVNVLAGGLLLYSLIVAARPADRDHPYGHGKVEFFSAGAEGTFIFLAGGLILWEAAWELVRGPELRRIDVGLALVLAMGLANAALSAYLVRVGRREHSLALVADGHHLRTDVVTSLGVVGGLAAVWATGWTPLDPLVAMAVAVHILFTGSRLVRKAVGGLMDEADEEMLRTLSDALEKHRDPAWIDVHSLRAFRSGAVQHVDLHMSVPRYFDVDALHRIDARVHRILLDAAGLPGDVIIHFDPCRPRQCPGCVMPECPVRAAPFARREPLSVQRTTRADEMLDTGRPLEPELHVS